MEAKGEQEMSDELWKDVDIRARSWGMEAFCEVLWNNAFQAGYREAMRDDARAALTAWENRNA